MIDRTTALASAVAADAGAYGLLLGSGVSRSSGILTGEQILLDLLKDLCAAEGEPPQENLFDWFESQYGFRPGYSTVLEQLNPSPEGRAILLRRYFEPDGSEEGERRATPTAAHRAIAGMVASGHIRLILTTNFDPLMERALDERRLRHFVLTPDNIQDRWRLFHEPCSVLKIHGDYRSLHTKNTIEELEQYPAELRGLLEQLFEAYGWIICGWSGETDHGLRDALVTSAPGRLPTHWSQRRAPKTEAVPVIEARQAIPIAITNADSFFETLAQRVEGIVNRQAVARARPVFAADRFVEYLMEDRLLPQLEALVTRETANIIAELPDHNAHRPDAPFTADFLRQRVQSYEDLTKTMRSMFILGCRWGREQHRSIWVNALESFVDLPGEEHGYLSRPDIRLYPALILVYAGGISAVHSEQYGNLAALLTEARMRRTGSTLRVPLVLGLHPVMVMQLQNGTVLSSVGSHYAPISAYVLETLRESFRSYVPQEYRYESAFHRFEYFWALVHADLYGDLGIGRWGPPGRLFMQGHRYHMERDQFLAEIEEEARRAGTNWAPLKAGLFGRSLDRFLEVKGEIDELFRRAAPW